MLRCGYLQPLLNNCWKLSKHHGDCVNRKTENVAIEGRRLLQIRDGNDQAMARNLRHPRGSRLQPQAAAHGRFVHYGESFGQNIHSSRLLAIGITYAASATPPSVYLPRSPPGVERCRPKLEWRSAAPMLVGPPFQPKDWPCKISDPSDKLKLMPRRNSEDVICRRISSSRRTWRVSPVRDERISKVFRKERYRHAG